MSDDSRSGLSAAALAARVRRERAESALVAARQRADRAATVREAAESALAEAKQRAEDGWGDGVTAAGILLARSGLAADVEVAVGQLAAAQEAWKRAGEQLRAAEVSHGEAVARDEAVVRLAGRREQSAFRAAERRRADDDD